MGSVSIEYVDKDRPIKSVSAHNKYADGVCGPELRAIRNSPSSVFIGSAAPSFHTGCNVSLEDAIEFSRAVIRMAGGKV